MATRIFRILFVAFALITKAQSWEYINTSNSNIPTNDIYDIFVENQNTIWFATYEDGIVMKVNDEFHSYNSTNVSTIKGNQFSVITKDNTSHYWFGSEYDGLYDFHNAVWKLYTPADMGFNFSPFESLHIRALAAMRGGPFNPDGHGSLWVGTYSHGLLKFDGTTWTHYDYNNSVPIMSVYAIGIEESPRDTNNVVWVGTSNGLIKYDGRNWEMVEIMGDSSKWINAIAFEDGGPTFGNGKMYVGTESGEFCIYDGNQWDIYNLADAWNPNNGVTSIAIDKAGRKWIGMEEEGLAMYDGTQLPFYYKDNSGIAGNNVVCVAVNDKADSTEVLLSCYDFDVHSYTGLTIYRVPLVTSVGNESGIVNKFELQQNYPNPFNPSTTIRFSVPEKGMVSLKVYNVLGQLVANLVNQELKAGSYEVDFDGFALSSGIYLYKLSTGNYEATKKMMLLK